MSRFKVGDKAILCCCDDLENNGREVVVVKPLSVYTSIFWSGERLCYGVEALDNGEWFAPGVHQLRRKDKSTPASMTDAMLSTIRRRLSARNKKPTEALEA